MADWLLIPYSVETIWLNRIISIPTLIHHSLLFLRVAFDQRKTKELARNNKYRQTLYITTIVTLFSFVLLALLNPLREFAIFYQFISCNTSLTLSVLTFWFTKYCLWLFSILRIRVVFHSEILMQYKPITLRLLFVFFTMVYFMVNFTTIGWCSGVQNTLPSPDQHVTYCEIQCALWVSAPNGLGDQIATIICLVLFWKRLKLLMKSINASKRLKFNAKLTYVMRKYTVLMATNIISTWILMFISTFTSVTALAGALDSIINMWTLVLFDTRYDNIYRKVFKCVSRTDLLTVNYLESQTTKTDIEVPPQNKNRSGTATQITKTNSTISNVTTVNSSEPKIEDVPL
eukprot:463139_1